MTAAHASAANAGVAGTVPATTSVVATPIAIHRRSLLIDSPLSFRGFGTDPMGTPEQPTLTTVRMMGARPSIPGRRPSHGTKRKADTSGT